MPRAQFIVTAICLALLTACGPSSEQVAQTMVAQTATVGQAIAAGIATGIAATETAKPTNTPIPTSTPTATLIATPTNTPSATPPAVSTPSQAQILEGKLYNSARSLKATLQNLIGGLDAGGERVWCSVEVRESVVTNYERLTTYPTYDDASLSANGKNVNFHYRVALQGSRDNANLQAVYKNCKDWIAAGKPSGFPLDSATVRAAINAVQSSLAIIKAAVP